jgi:hypothetical protein
MVILIMEIPIDSAANYICPTLYEGNSPNGKIFRKGVHARGHLVTVHGPGQIKYYVSTLKARQKSAFRPRNDGVEYVLKD